MVLIPFLVCVCVWISFFGLFSFLVSLDDAICVVGECEFLQCTVLGKHGAVSDDVTLRGRDVIFFLKQAKIIFTLSLRTWHAPTGRE